MFAFQARRYGVLVALVVLVGGLLVATIPAAASAHGKKASPWTTSISALPANAESSPVSTFTSESCPANGSCVAVGAYIDASGGQEALLDTLSAGVWTPMAAPLPTNGVADAGAGADVTSVTCVAAGSCVAVGAYSAKRGKESGLVETLSQGVWTPEQVLSTKFTDLGFTAVTCPAAGSCVAVGEGSNAIGDVGGVIGTLSGGAWTVTAVALPPSVPAQAVDLLDAVTCPAVGSCVAVGGYAVLGKPIVEQGLIVTLSAGRWTATVAPLGSKKSARDLNFLESVACSSVGSCVAGGSTAGKSGRHGQGLLESLSNGTWSQVAVPLPSDAEPGEFSDFGAVSCPAAGTCVAVSGYTDASGNQQGLIETLASGMWTATEASVPTDAGADPMATLGGVSCPSAGSCVAVGGFADTSGASEGLVDTLSDGTWTATEVPLPAATFGGVIPVEATPFSKSTFRLSSLLAPKLTSRATATRRLSWARPFPGFRGVTSASATAKPVTVAFLATPSLTAVACATTDSCAAVGSLYTATGEEGLIATLSGGTWTTSEAVPADAIMNTSAQLEAVACGAPASCLAAGSYDDTNGETQGFVETLSGGTAAALELPVPSDAATDPEVNLAALTCPATGSCVAVGNYFGANGNLEGLVVTLAQGTWTATGVPLPAGTTNPNASLMSVACAETGTCVAVGGTFDATGRVEQAIIETLASGTWTPSVPTLPGKTSAHEESVLSSVSCPAAGLCQAVGAYAQGKSAQGLLETLTDGTWTVASVPAPGAPTRALSDLSGVSCADVSTCVAVGTYLDSTGVHSFFDTLNDGTWTQTEAPAPSKTSAEALLGAVSCPSSTGCVAVGSEEGESHGEEAIGPYFDTLQGKKWTSAAAPVPSGAFLALLSSVSCAAAGSCVSVGSDATLSGSIGGFIDTLSSS